MRARDLSVVLRPLRAALVVALLGVFPACSGSTGTVSGSTPAPAPATGVTVYTQGATGNAAPLRSIAGPSTGLQFPSAIAVDATGNRYVADRAADSVSAFAGNARGNSAPFRTIAGMRTGLNLPTGIALDRSGDVYVVNRSGNAITVYRPAANGNARPNRTIAGSATELNGPTSIALDDRQNIYVTNLGEQSVAEFAPAANGNVAPLRVIRGKRTRLTGAFGIAVDRAGTVYVVNSDDSGIEGVLIFGATAKGNVAPSRIIAGSATELETPSGVAVDESGRIFVSDHGGNSTVGAIRVYATDAKGNAAPAYSIAGSATRLRPYGLTIAPSGEINAVNKTE